MSYLRSFAGLVAAFVAAMATATGALAQTPPVIPGLPPPGAAPGGPPGGGPPATVAPPTTAVDAEAPTVRALASSGRVGTRVRLRFRAFDASGETRERIRVTRRGRVVRTIRTTPSASKAGETYFVTWRARKVGTYRFCVTAWDAVGNRGGPSCARALVRARGAQYSSREMAGVERPIAASSAALPETRFFEFCTNWYVNPGGWYEIRCKYNGGNAWGYGNHFLAYLFDDNDYYYWGSDARWHYWATCRELIAFGFWFYNAFTGQWYENGWANCNYYG